MDRTVILTTHSPHIASVTPLESLVVLRLDGLPSQTTARSTIAADFSPTDIDDLERYLDVTRGELLFSKGVILVEGEAETYLVPAFAHRLGVDLDELGISVCSVGGINFLPFVKLLGRGSLEIPFAVITDEDPVHGGLCLAHNRVSKLMETIDPKHELPKASSGLFSKAATFGVFVTSHTLEVALFNCGRHKALTETIQELSTNGAAQERAKAWRADPSSLDTERLLSDIEQIGKGRFAQRLAGNLSKQSGNACPESVKGAIAHVAKQV